MRSALSIQHDYERRTTRSMHIIREYVKGVPLADMVRTFEMAPGSIGRIVRLAGIPKRRPGNTPEVRKAVARDYKAGVPIKEIIKKHGVNRKSVWVICDKEGVPPRQPHKTKRKTACK